MFLGILFLVFGFSQDISTANKPNEVKALLHFFHEMIESDVEERPFKEYLLSLHKKDTLAAIGENINLVRMGVDTFRAYSIKSQEGHLGDHVKNLAFIFPLSHGIESIAGEVASLVATTMGSSLSTIGMLEVIGGIIKVPGLDPLCILLFLSYPLPPVQKAVNLIRGPTTKAFHFIYKVSGLRSLQSLLVNQVSPLESMYGLEERGWRFYQINEALYNLSKEGFRITIESANDVFYVRELEAKNFYVDWLNDLPFNIRYAIRRHLLERRNAHYIEGRKDFTTRFMPFALPWRSHYKSKVEPQKISKNFCHFLF